MTSSLLIRQYLFKTRRISAVYALPLRLNPIVTESSRERPFGVTVAREAHRMTPLSISAAHTEPAKSDGSGGVWRSLVAQINELEELAAEINDDLIASGLNHHEAEYAAVSQIATLRELLEQKRRLLDAWTRRPPVTGAHAKSRL